MLATARPRDARSLLRAGDVVDLEPGRFLHRAGSRVTSAYLLLSGAVELVVDGEVHDAVGPDELVGLVEALDGDAPATDAVVVEPSQAIVLTAPRLRGLVETNPAVRAAVLRQLASRARRRAS